MNCFGAPTGSLVLPPPVYIFAPYKSPSPIFYFTVETGNVSGPGTFALQITEAGTGKVVVTFSDNVTFTANSTQGVLLMCSPNVNSTLRGQSSDGRRVYNCF